MIIGDLTKNLSRYEFACKCECGFDTADFELVNALQDCADHFSSVDLIDIRVDITGPNRCVKHNEDEQKRHNPDYVPLSSNSQHIYGRAADFKLFHRGTGEQVGTDRVADYLETKYQGKYGIGRYSNRTHFDTRTSTSPARWDVRSK